MSEEFGTRDVLEQVDKRLSSLEQDVRALRTETQGGFKDLREEMRTLRSEMSLHNRWLNGGMLTIWLSLMASLWLKP